MFIDFIRDLGNFDPIDSELNDYYSACLKSIDDQPDPLNLNSLPYNCILTRRTHLDFDFCNFADPPNAKLVAIDYHSTWYRHYFIETREIQVTCDHECDFEVIIHEV